MPELTPEQAKKSLTADQYKLYNLIWKRFMASLMANCIQNTVRAEIEALSAQEPQEGGHYLFTASGYSIKFDGFTVLYEESTDDAEADGRLPEIKEGDKLKLK